MFKKSSFCPAKVTVPSPADTLLHHSEAALQKNNLFLLYMGTHHFLLMKDAVSASTYVFKYCRIVTRGELTPESRTYVLVGSEAIALCHTLRASGKKKLEEGSPKRMNCGI